MGAWGHGFVGEGVGVGVGVGVDVGVRVYVVPKTRQGKSCCQGRMQRRWNPEKAAASRRRDGIYWRDGVRKQTVNVSGARYHLDELF